MSGTASEFMSGVVSGVNDVASSVSHSVEAVVSSVSSGVGEAVHNVSSGMKRLMTSPPSEALESEAEDSSSLNSILPTPDYSGIIETGLNYLPVSSSLMESSFEQNNEKEFGISENYFSQPEIFELGSDSNIEDIEEKITKTKDHILNCEESTQRRRYLVQRLIQLRLALERVKEEKEVEEEGVQVRQGHQLAPLLPRLKASSKQFCDKCSQVIWSVIHVTYRCTLCDYQCHGKCVKSKHPKCPSVKFADNPMLITKICPEYGLHSQDYRCAQCRILINNRNVWGEPRLCDYTGKFFCPACHWNARMIIPARIIHNWDFEEQLVSQQAKHFLTYVKEKPLMALEELNPSLFKFVKELHVVKVCRGKGFICELCDSEEVIFPFDEGASVCKMCQASFHKSCFELVSVCPRCIRHSSRRLKHQEEHTLGAVK